MTLISQLLDTVKPQLADRIPWRVSTRQLSRETTTVLAKIRRNKTSAVITYRGMPSFLLVPLDPDQFTSLLLSAAPDLFEKDVLNAEHALEADDLSPVPGRRSPAGG